MVKRTRPSIPTRQSLLATLAYGGLLALGTLALSWLNYHRMALAFPWQVQVLGVAAVFLVLGVWAGARLFAGRGEVPAFDGNPEARRSLGLSERETEVLGLLAAGLSNKEIAARLGVSPNTVKTHVARLLEKLDARRRTEAILKARELGILA
jgi:DNA-binding CsgD family transcriptional regulator